MNAKTCDSGQKTATRSPIDHASPKMTSAFNCDGLGPFGRLHCCAATHADLAQLVEQLFRKQQVRGSSPRVGSGRAGAIRNAAEVAKWQTRYVQGVVGQPVGVQISPSAPVSRDPESVARRIRTLTTENVERKDGRWPHSG